MANWTVGDVKITKVLEFEENAADPGLLMPAAKAEELRKIAWLYPNYVSADDKLRMSFHALVLETPSRTIMVDTCIGADKERGIPPLDHLKTSFLQDFETAGFTRDGIDVVVCTHLHIDHVGWNTMLVDGKWIPTFPKARFLIGRNEFEHWKTQENDAHHRQVFVDSVQPVWDAGQVDLVAPDHRICDEVRLMPTPGHTPGHVSVIIESKGERALITGDFVHHPSQLVHPEWTTFADVDPDRGVRTRRELFAELAGKPVLVIGTHFMPPTVGHIVREGAAFRFVAEEGRRNR